MMSLFRTLCPKFGLSDIRTTWMTRPQGGWPGRVRGTRGMFIGPMARPRRWRVISGGLRIRGRRFEFLVNWSDQLHDPDLVPRPHAPGNQNSAPPRPRAPSRTAGSDHAPPPRQASRRRHRPAAPHRAIHGRAAQPPPASRPAPHHAVQPPPASRPAPRRAAQPSATSARSARDSATAAARRAASAAARTTVAAAWSAAVTPRRSALGDQRAFRPRQRDSGGEEGGERGGENHGGGSVVSRGDAAPLSPRRPARVPPATARQRRRGGRRARRREPRWRQHGQPR